ncbi:MAG: peptide MFS transporter [Caulobacteraceae bacterium]|nr:peptide MFS transporter [Caulobacteraceae bacterium]
MIEDDAVALSANDKAFLGHPKGLGYLAFTEAWERFSYYGMQGLLALYMIQQLLLPGHVENVIGADPFLRWIAGTYGAHDPKAQSSAIFGLYTSIIYISPLLGGFIADRLLGRTRTIVMGAVVMAMGHFLMAFDQSFLLALACLVFGAGCLKGNIASQVGGLYKAGDNRAADAFQIFYLAINAGAIAAPLVCGTLGQKVGWHYGFGVAGIGMLISLMIYLAGRKYLPPDPNIRRPGEASAAPRQGWRKGDTLTFLILLFLLPVLAVGVTGNQQIFNAYQVWVDETANLTFFGFSFPSTWIQFIDTIASVSFLAGAVVFWRWWATFAKEPTEMTKIGIGSIIAVSGMLCLAAGAYVSQQTGQKVDFAWLLAFHILNSIGFANVFPVALAFYARCAPPALGATMIGIFYLHLAAANQIVGWLGGQTDKMTMVQFWLVHAAMCGAAGVIFLLLKPIVWPVLAPKPQPADAAPA